VKVSWRPARGGETVVEGQEGRETKKAKKGKGKQSPKTVFNVHRAEGGRLIARLRKPVPTDETVNISGGERDRGD